MEKIRWIDRVKYVEVLRRIKAGKKHLTLNKIKEGYVDWSHHA